MRKSLTDCLKIRGLDKHTKAIIKGRAQSYKTQDGFEAHEAAVRAVDSYINDLNQELQDIYSQLPTEFLQQNGYLEEPPSPTIEPQLPQSEANDTPSSIPAVKTLPKDTGAESSSGTTEDLSKEINELEKLLKDVDEAVSSQEPVVLEEGTKAFPTTEKGVFIDEDANAYKEPEIVIKGLYKPLDVYTDGQRAEAHAKALKLYQDGYLTQDQYGRMLDIAKKGDIKVIDKIVDTVNENPTNPHVAFSKTSGDEHYAKIGINIERMLAQEGNNLYKAGLVETIVKELVQNSFDAVKGSLAQKQITQGAIEIRLNEDDRTITIKDNGVGMNMDTFKKAFLTLWGTEKEGLSANQRSGSKGKAKMTFLLGARRVTLETTKDGETLSLTATPSELIQGSNPIGRKKTPNIPNGTSVTIEIPESIEVNGESERIWFPRPSEIKDVSIFRKPLIGGNIDFILESTNIQSIFDSSQPKILRENLANFSLQEHSFFDKVKFKWGYADIYVKNSYAKHPIIHILSSGVWQFDKWDDKIKQGLPHNLIIDVHSSVEPTDRLYPFNSAREDWSSIISEDVSNLMKFLENYSQSVQAEDTVNRFKDFKQLPLVELDGSTDIQITPAPIIDFKPETNRPPLQRSQEESEKARDTSEATDLEEFFRKIAEAQKKKEEATRKAPEKKVESSFESEKKLKTAKDFLIEMGVDDKLPIYHNNTNVDWLTEYPSTGQMFAELGTFLQEVKTFMLENSRSLLKKYDDDYKTTPLYVGISIDKQYQGVNIKIPYSGILINPLANLRSTVPGIYEAWYQTIIHEFTHEVVREHNENFIGDLHDIMAKIAETGKDVEFRNKLRLIAFKHRQVLNELRTRYSNFSTKNVSKSISDTGKDEVVKSGLGHQRSDVSQHGNSARTDERGSSSWAESHSESYSDDEGHVEFSIEHITITAPQNPQKHAIFRKFVESINEKLKHLNVEINYASSPTDTGRSYIDYQVNKVADPNKIGGLIFNKLGDTKKEIWIFGHNKTNLAELQRTVFHELVGHYGARQVLGKDWFNFLDRLINDKELVKEIYSTTRLRWKHILEDFPVNGKDDIDIDGVKVSREALRELADEYIAEAAATLPKTSAGALIESLAKRELGYTAKASILNKAIAAIKHFMRKLGFLQYSEISTKDDIQTVLAKSYQMIFSPVIDEHIETYDDMVRTNHQLYSISNTFFHASDKVYDKLDFSKSKDFGIHFGDSSTVDNIRLKSKKSEIYEATFDPTDFIELPDLDSWRIPELVVHIQEHPWMKGLPLDKQEYFKRKADSFIKQYNALIRPGNDMVAVSARLNKELQKLLTSPIYNLKGIKYINNKEGSGTYSFIVLDPSVISTFKSTNISSASFSLSEEDREHVDWFTNLTKGFGENPQSALENFWTSSQEAYNRQPNTTNLSYLGKLPFKKEIMAVFRKALGLKNNVDDLSLQIYNKGKSFDILQKRAMYEYLTTPDADIQTYNRMFDPETLSLFERGKQTVMDLGQSLVDLGKLDKDVYERNKGKYLRTRYAAFMQEYKGSGKSTSFQNYLKKKGDLTEEEKTKYLVIKDPTYLLIDTIGTIGRDVGLLRMFSTLDTLSAQHNLPWVIGGSEFMWLDDKSYTLESARELLEQQETVLKNDGEILGWDHPQVEMAQAEYDKLKAAFDEAYAKLDAKIKSFAMDIGQPELTAKEYAEQFYKQLPKHVRFGKLAGMYVRKEIYDDFKEAIDLMSDQTGQKQLYKTLERYNGYWKASKVTWNPASWLRNLVGNFVLLDIGSPTNPITLTKMFLEVTSPTNSIYWTIGKENGVFGTTYSAQELYNFENEFELKFKSLAAKATGKKGFISNLSLIADIQESLVEMNETLSNLYGKLEGVFKVVAIRDHIERWEKNTGMKFKELSNAQREAVIAAAVNHANESIFDYSAVPNFIKQARRFPLGSPFITFTYKAFPQVIKALVSRPQKFIPYVTAGLLMPAIFLAANPDLDDKDRDEIIAKYPVWMRDKSSMALLPYKDSNGKWQIMDLGYFFPWAPFTDAVFHAQNHFEGGSTANVAKSTMDEAYNIIGNTFGFLGGPLPQTIAALKNNQDPFSHKPIFKEGDPSGKQLVDLMRYSWNTAMPSWITDNGALGHIIDSFGIQGISEPLNQFGTPKETSVQAWSRLAGVNIYSTAPNEANRSNLKYYSLKEQEITRAKKEVLQNRNLDQESKLAAIKEYNDKLRVARKERMDYIKSTHGQ